MPLEYTISDLARLARVTPRTVRYYVSQGLLPPPTQAGSAARYGESHLDRLRLIKKLQAAHLPLAEIRTRMRALPEDELARLVDEAPADEPRQSALDYIETVLSGAGRGQPRHSLPVPPPVSAPMAVQAMELPARAVLPPPAPAALPPAAPGAPGAPGAPEGTPSAEPERAQWERITLDPDVELHVRRPLTRQQNKRVERLISIARQLLEED